MTVVRYSDSFFTVKKLIKSEGVYKDRKKLWTQQDNFNALKDDSLKHTLVLLPNYYLPFMFS